MKKNKSQILYLTIAAVTLAGATLVWINYDEWFIYPSKRTFVTTNLKDPMSVQFRNEKLMQSQWLCGEINAKNGMGVYSGFKRFAVRDAQNAWLEGEGDVSPNPQKLSTPQIISDLEKQTARLNQINDYKRERGKKAPFEPLTEADLRLERFEDKWKEICG